MFDIRCKVLALVLETFMQHTFHCLEISSECLVLDIRSRECLFRGAFPSMSRLLSTKVRNVCYMAYSAVVRGETYVTNC
jgi:hypothetical protein